MAGALLDAAYAAAAAGGWERARMADVARAAGVSRQTLYNEFRSKDGLAQALALRETERFLAGVRTELGAHPGDTGAAIEAAVSYTLRRAADDALLKAIVTSARGESLLPFLTTRAEPLLVAARAQVARHLRGIDPRLDLADVALVAESVVRLTVSHIVLPLRPPAEVARDLAALAERILHPGAPGAARPAGSPARSDSATLVAES